MLSFPYRPSPPLGPGKRPPRQRILSQWRGIDLAPLEKFIHEIGLKDFTAEEKLTVTAASLPAEGEQTRFVIMKPNGQSAI